MASLEDTIERAGRRLGLHVRLGKKTAVGVKNGYLVQLLRHRSPEWDESILEIIRHGDKRSLDVVGAAIHASPELAAAGIETKNVDVGEGMVTHKHVRRLFRSLSDDAVARKTDALLRAVRDTCPAMPEACRLCGGGGAAEPILLNDVVDRICPSCLERLRYEANPARERYVNLPLNLPQAALTGAVRAVVAAIACAGFGILTYRPWLMAFPLGLWIGFGTSRAAGKRGPATQSLVVLFTVLFVLLGEAMMNAYRVLSDANAHGSAIDWGAFVRAALEMQWEEKGFFTFFFLGLNLCAALVGAYLGMARFAKPRFDVKVERS